MGLASLQKKNAATKPPHTVSGTHLNAGLAVARQIKAVTGGVGKEGGARTGVVVQITTRSVVDRPVTSRRVGWRQLTSLDLLEAGSVCLLLPISTASSPTGVFRRRDPSGRARGEPVDGQWTLNKQTMLTRASSVVFAQPLFI